MQCRRIDVKKCLCHNRFSLRFHCGKGNRISHWKIRLLYLLRKNWRWTEPAVGYRHFRERSRCAAMTFRRISIEIRLLYVPFGKCLSDVDKTAFSAFRTRFSTSEYTYTTPPKIERKIRCAATTFWSLNAKMIVSENRLQSTYSRCYEVTSRFDNRRLMVSTLCIMIPVE